MRKIYLIFISIMLLCAACEWRMQSKESISKEGTHQVVARYDQTEGAYLLTGDFSALQRMSTEYPNQTRTLVENVLKLGAANDPEINAKLLNYYQDSTLQRVIAEVGRQYANMDDIDKLLYLGFKRLKKHIPSLAIPKVYAQIGAFDQSVIVGKGMLGISLDKYLGNDYPIYQKYYSKEQRRTMNRSYIAPDCIGFYLLSLYPMPTGHELTKNEKDIHMAKIQWVVDKALKKDIFANLRYVKAVDKYMETHGNVSFDVLLRDNRIDSILSR